MNDRPAITIPEITMHFSIAIVLTKLCGVTPDLAELIGLWVQAKSKQSPGGKSLTDEEKVVLRAALQDVVDELKD